MSAVATDLERKILAEHAEDAALLAEAAEPASNLADFAAHLTRAARNAESLNLTGADELGSVAELLQKAASSDPAERVAPLKLAMDELIGDEAMEEYREMHWG